MNRIARFLAISGLGLMAGATIGVGTAQAASASSQGATHRVVSHHKAHFDDDTEVIGYYSTRLRCELAGERGELRNRWDDYDCTKVKRGHHRGDYMLEVSYDRGSGWWHGGFRPHFPGGPFGGPFGGHGRPGGPFGGPGRPGGPFGGPIHHGGPFGGPLVPAGPIVVPTGAPTGGPFGNPGFPGGPFGPRH